MTKWPPTPRAISGRKLPIQSDTIYFPVVVVPCCNLPSPLPEYFQSPFPYSCLRLLILDSSLLLRSRYTNLRFLVPSSSLPFPIPYSSLVSLFLVQSLLLYSFSQSPHSYSSLCFLIPVSLSLFLTPIFVFLFLIPVSFRSWPTILIPIS